MSQTVTTTLHDDIGTTPTRSASKSYHRHGVFGVQEDSSTFHLVQSSTPIPVPAPVVLQNAQTSAYPESERQPPVKGLSKGAAILLIGHNFLANMTCSVTNGLITIAIPTIAKDVELDQSLVHWPVLIYTLTCATFLLLAGAVADVIGRRFVNLASLFILGVFALACGLAKDGQQLIAFRALGGIGSAFFLPTSTSFISSNIPEGKMRNIGFSLLGAGMVIGFALGLVLGGVFVNTIGWRAGYLLFGGIFLGLCLAGIWALPPDQRIRHTQRSTIHDLRTKIDCVGVALASAAIALLAYVLSQISSTASNIKQSINVALLTIALVLLPVCVMWFEYQEKNDRPALIPNSLWKKLPFSTVCIMVMFAYASMQTMELLASLFFQQVQDLSAIEASIRILPSLIVGTIIQFLTGALVHRFPAMWLVLITSALSAGAPLLMAFVESSWPYWRVAFPAQILHPLCVEVLFTVALLLITTVFPEKDQALAGAVFNVVGQFGQAVGLAIIDVITNTITARDSTDLDRGELGKRMALLRGYHAGFWTAFAWIASLCVACVIGLRKVGKVGIKRD